MRVIRRTWQNLARLQTAAILLVAVTGLVLVASFLPQLPPGVRHDPAAVTAWREAAQTRYGGWAEPLWSLGLFRFSTSPLFLLAAGLLTTSAVACTCQRWPRRWRLARDDDAASAALQPGSAPLAAVLAGPANQAAQLACLTNWLLGRGYRVRQVSSGETVLVHAHRYRWVNLATLGTHVSILLVLLGALLSTWLASEQQLQIASGAAVPLASNTSLALRNDGFAIQRHDDGSPALFEAQIALLDGGEIVRQVALRVNEPLSVRGYRVYLSSYWGQPGQYGIVLLVGRNPGYLPFLCGGLLLLASVTLTVYLPSRRIVARVAADGAVTLWGWPARYDTSLRAAWPGLLAALQAASTQDEGELCSF